MFSVCISKLSCFDAIKELSLIHIFYYTSASTETQTLTVVVEDNFGKSYEMEFSFNDTDEEEKFARSANKLGSV